MKLRKVASACCGAVLLMMIIALSACAPSPAVIYQGAPGQATAAAISGGVIVSQQSLGLWVNGLGKTTGVPDIVVLTLGVQSQDKTVAVAQKAAIDAMNGVMKVLKDSGIAEKDIRTSQYNIQQLTRWDEKQSMSVVIGYQVSNMVSVKIRDMGKAGSVIDNAAAAGGDLIRVNGISFMVDDPTPLLKIARDKAIQDAMDKAKQMSQASGAKLGKLIYMNESTPYVPVVQNSYLKMAAADMAPAPTPISPGELEFQVNVQLVYEMN
jgi:uncharacterized protein